MSVAELGIAVDSSGLKKGTVALDQFDSAATKADQSAKTLGKSVSGAMKEAGAGSAEFATAAKAATGAADSSARALHRAGEAHAGLSTQAMAAGHAMRSTVEMLAQGVPISQVLAMHINELSYAATGPGGLKGAFKEATSVLTGFLTPTIMVGGAVAALGLSAVGAAVHWQNAESTIQHSLRGIGGASLATVNDIESISAAIASTGKMSYGEARDAATAIASVGTVGVKNIHPLVVATEGLSKILGVDTTKAAHAAALAIGNLATGSTSALLKLNASVGFLSGTSFENIQNLAASGHSAEAQQHAIDAIANATKRATQQTGFWELSWQGVKNFSSAAINGIGKELTDLTGIGETLGHQYDVALEKLQALQAQAQKNSSQGGLLSDFRGNVLARDIQAQQTAVDNLQKKLIQNGVDEFNTKQRKLGLEAQQAAAKIATEYEQVRKLRQAISTIQKGPAGKSGNPQESALALARINTELKNRENTDGSIITLEQHQTDLFHAQLQAVSARTLVERESAAAEMARTQAINSSISKDVLARRAAAMVQAEANAKANDQIFALQNQYQILTAVTGEEKLRAEYNATIAQLIHSGTDPLKAQEISLAQMDDRQASINAQVKRQTEQLNQQTELIKARQRGDEASVAAAQAYTRAIQEGASADEAAANAAAVKANYAARAAASAISYGKASAAAANGGGGMPNSFSLPAGMDYANNPTMLTAIAEAQAKNKAVSGSAGPLNVNGMPVSPSQPVYQTTSGAGGVSYAINPAYTPPPTTFADGGVMTKYGPLPLRRYAGGGVANTPQMALFGEGSGPEAFVPLKNGGIPVHMNSSGIASAVASAVAAAMSQKGNGDTNINGPIQFLSPPPHDARSRTQIGRQVKQMFRSM